MSLNRNSPNYFPTWAQFLIFFFPHFPKFDELGQRIGICLGEGRRPFHFLLEYSGICLLEFNGKRVHQKNQKSHIKKSNYSNDCLTRPLILSSSCLLPNLGLFVISKRHFITQPQPSKRSVLLLLKKDLFIFASIKLLKVYILSQNFCENANKRTR